MHAMFLNDIALWLLMSMAMACILYGIMSVSFKIGIVILVALRTSSVVFPDTYTNIKKAIACPNLVAFINSHTLSRSLNANFL